MNTRTGIIAGIGVVALVALGVWFMLGRSSAAKPAPNAEGYYTGPMLNKSRTAITTEDNRVVGKSAPRGGGGKLGAMDAGR